MESTEEKYIGNGLNRGFDARCLIVVVMAVSCGLCVFGVNLAEAEERNIFEDYRRYGDLVRTPYGWSFKDLREPGCSPSYNVGRESKTLFEKQPMGKVIPFYAEVWVYCDSGEMGFYFPGWGGSIGGGEGSYVDSDGYLHGYADMKVKFDGDSWVKASARFPGKGSPTRETLVSRGGHGCGGYAIRSTSWSNVFISGNWIERMKKHNTLWIEFKYSGYKKIAEFGLSGFTKEFRKCK